MPAGPWLVVVTQSAHEVYAPSRRALALGAVVLLLPVGGLALLAAYLKRRLIEPINALYWASEQVAFGHLDVRVQIGRGDEMELVGHQFNRMAAALQRHEDDQRSEIRRRTEELRQSDIQARRVRDAVSAQMQAISSGLRRCLDRLKGASQMGLKQAAELHAETCRAAAALAADLADLCAVEGGQMRLEPQEVSLADVLASATRILDPLIEQYGARIELPPDAETHHFTADKAKLKQVFYSLLCNAIKYGGQGSTVTVTAEEREEGTVVGIRDRGPGIPPERRERIFDPLGSPTPQPESPAERTGLSLPIAKQLVELHGGRLWVESVLDEGSTFYLLLPHRE
ncbi:MAG: HAMP domain-containing sensor histidine kinase [Planctomycetota bacterium]